MTRKEFIKICGLFGIGLPFQSMLSSCTKVDDISTPFSGKVLIIGAGAVGLSTGYFLNQQGTDFEILEASSKSKLNAINDAVVWDGFKAFFEFSSNFYGDSEYKFEITSASSGKKIYYNASLGQNTTKNILGLFVMGTPAQEFISRSGTRHKHNAS